MTTQRNLHGTGTSPVSAEAAVGMLRGNTTLTATGTNQATALAIPSDSVVFTTVAASTGGVLPAAANVDLMDWYTVVNHGAQTLSIYPSGTGTIANGSASAAFSVAATKTAFFLYLGGNNWAASLSA